ncbi:MAG: hypothetical protein KKF46_08095 [Nanoarchaeota archaeon]|nr:hypothetical protein [Nanoarchaeota archaeon]MBU1322289.1 hypothetical protein [Nanoarchaeota archaeon]MBU1597828.1 hypothetical protein [Nanoarchaeota archaeon]MBU2441081.1 hypothetical protein [Nanoarchaeota archaeon]
MKKISRVFFLFVLIIIASLLFYIPISMSVPSDQCCNVDECDDCELCSGSPDCSSQPYVYGSCVPQANKDPCNSCSSGYCECRAGVCEDKTCYNNNDCGDCQKCSNSACTADNAATCSSCSSGICVCSGGSCKNQFAGKAVYKIKNEPDILEKASVNRFACIGLSGVNIIDENPTNWISIGSSETKCLDNKVICGFKAGDDGDQGEIDYMKCCKLDAGGKTISLVGTGNLDPNGRNTEAMCSDNGVAVYAKQLSDDGVHEVYCAKVLVDGVVAGRINTDVGWKEIDRDDEAIMCTMGSGSGSDPPPEIDPRTFNCSAAACVANPERCKKCCKCEGATGPGYYNVPSSCKLAKKNCTEIYEIHDAAIVCGCGSAKPPCNVIEKVGDCGDYPDECKWCHTPSPEIYPYNFSAIYDEIFVDAATKKACVNITADPFNCGGCGFADADGKSETDFFCGFENRNDRPGSPFCVESECVGRSDATSENVVLPSKEKNPYFYYDVKTSATAYGTQYSSEWGDGSSLPIYLSHDIDSSETICLSSEIGGTDFVDGLGCCGNGKCREKGTSMCNVNAICDGIYWHDATADEDNDGEYDSNGEIFKAPDCEQDDSYNYPIANINGIFKRCVDFDRPSEYVQSRHTGICAPDLVMNNSVWSNALIGNNYAKVTGANEGASEAFDSGLTGGREYACGKDYYTVAGNRGLVASHGNFCPGHPIDAIEVEEAGTRGSFFICDASGDTYTFAAILDAGRIISGGESLGSVFIPEDDNAPGKNRYDICPAPVLEWKEKTSATATEYTSEPRNELVVLPCPGKISLSNMDLENSFLINNIERSWSVSYGGAYSVTVNICRPRLDDTDNSGKYPLPRTYYFLSNGTMMGDVNNNSYLCFTDETMLPQHDEPSRAKIGVCCGDDGCGDIDIGSGGNEYNPGDYVNVSGKIVYCMHNGSWSEDLDYNDTAIQGACLRAGHFATDNFCCAESDDTRPWISESYNDPGSEYGACFKAEPQYNDYFMSFNGTAYPNVFVNNGTFFGCGFNNSLFESEYNLSIGIIAGENVNYLPDFITCDLFKQVNSSNVCVLDDNNILNDTCLYNVEDWPNPGTGCADTKTGEPLIKEVEYCTIINTSSSGDFYCSYNNTWNVTGGENLSHNSAVPDILFNYINQSWADSGKDTSLLQEANCCRPNECWDADKGVCIPEQTGFDEYILINETVAYKCLLGEWINVLATGKRTPDGCYAGICPEASQCLYDITGNSYQNNNVSNSANPQCIDNNQYIGDALCVNGMWESRTKRLAEEMSALVGNNDNFVIMCGTPDDVLINLDHNIGASNNYCVLNLDGQRIIGTTLNQPLYDSETHNDFITAFEQTFLVSYPEMGVSFNSNCGEDTDDFDRCINNDYVQLYYDDNYQMVVFSNEPVDNLIPGLFSGICDNPPWWIGWLCPAPSGLETNLASLQMFNKVYAARLGNKEVFGVAEKECNPMTLRKTWLFSFNYTGFGSADLGHLVAHVQADDANITESQNNIFIRNPDADAWTALTLLRNTEQE